MHLLWFKKYSIYEDWQTKKKRLFETDLTPEMIILTLWWCQKHIYLLFTSNKWETMQFCVILLFLIFKKYTYSFQSVSKGRYSNDNLPIGLVFSCSLDSSTACVPVLSWSCLRKKNHLKLNFFVAQLLCN